MADPEQHKKHLQSTAMRRASEWIFSQEIPSDFTVHVGEASFALHKFPLVSKCGHIRKLVSESSDGDVTTSIELHDCPGGAEAFELAAMFCYRINFEINTKNIAMLRCAAEYLVMTEEYTVGNLVGRSEAYINEVALKSLSGAVSVLHMSQSLLPTAEKVKLVSRCIDAIAILACKDTHWWAEDLTVLRIDIFQRVLVAMMSRGYKHYSLGPVLMLYAQKSLRGLEVFGKGRNKIEAEQQEKHEKRVVLETIVSLLPREKNALSVSFLSMLLRAAIYLETTVACRLDLERRMGAELGEGVLDDLLIPLHAFTGHTLFDVDTVHRILLNFVEFQHISFPSSAEFERVGKLMENYMAEIASDPNLSLSKFINLVELVPEHSRATEDGIYRAIDIYLKAHPGLSDMERKKVCSLMDCQKLSRQACAHAAHNDRLPVQTVVQVLYYEQQRLRDVVNDGVTRVELPPISDELSILRRENEELKVEVVKIKMKLREFEKPSISSSQTNTQLQAAAENPPPPKKSFINSVSKRLGRLYPFVGADGVTSNSKGRVRRSKDRRHSIS
ncbi:BTB/POZ domain-containing protein SR1IP1-like [Cucurbita maxima]|uniref:BTB/POZ domain-containing protein SR1IP1-like n=1 Tax=Cucurbita maxima TaxID=3661 RepID=A0A6J1JGX1_CUCMA|nr:BTB/POZ domain-containing protein SR1IP1-like [Cucurbita maxima]